MRRMGTMPHRSVTGTEAMTFQETNPEEWVQLGEELRNTNSTILEIVQDLK